MNAPTQRTEGSALSTATMPEYQVSPHISGQDLILRGDYFEKVDRLSSLMSKATGAVPKHLINNPGACFSVTLTALRANFDPFGVARKTWMGPDNTIKYEAQLVIALINNSGLLAERLRWEYFGDWQKILGRFERRQTKKKDAQGHLKTDANGEISTYIARTWTDADEKGLGVRCIGRLKGEAEPRVTELLMAQAVTRNSTLWVEDPRQQIAYLSGFRWGRLHTPEAIMGIYTPDEDFGDKEKFMGDAEEVRQPAGGPAPAPAPKQGEGPKLQAADSDEAFEKRLPIYQGYLASGKTHEEIVAFIKSKRVLTAEQEKRVRGLKAPGETAAGGDGHVTDVQPKQKQNGGPEITFAVVADRIAKAKNTDELADAGTLIGEVPDEGLRRELATKYDARLAELTKE